MDKILKMLGMQEEHDEEMEQDLEIPELEPVELVHSDPIGKKTMRMVVLNCQYITDATQVVDNLKVNRPVIVTLPDADLEESQRIIDFISGAVYAMEGEVEKISNETFVFAPKNFIVDKKKCEALVKEDIPLFVKKAEAE